MAKPMTTMIAGESGAKPAYRAVHFDVTGPNKRGLKKVEDDPRRECDSVYQRRNGRGIAGWRRASLIEWLNPQTTIVRKSSDIEK